MRSQVAIKLFGDDIETLRETGEAIARVLGTVAGTVDLRVEKVAGQQYLIIDVDRTAMARYGINAADVHDVIRRDGRGGTGGTDIFEGERRFAAVVAGPRNSSGAARTTHPAAFCYRPRAGHARRSGMWQRSRCARDQRR